MKLLLAAAKAAGAVTLALGVAAAAHAQANVLVNGSFETGLASWTTSGFTLQGYDYGTDSAAQSGASAFYGGAVGGLGFLSQSFASIAGQQYGIDLWLASDGFLPNRFQVVANGQVLLDLEDVLLQPYRAVHTAFTATGSLTQLQFGFRNDSGSLHLDSVTVTAIPEPTTVILLALGLGGLAIRRRQMLSSGAA